MKKTRLLRLISRYSGLTFIALVIYFLLMKLLNLASMVELRFVNLIILFLGIRFFLGQVRRENNDSLEYLKSLAYGFIVSIFTSLYFALFIFLYLSLADKSFLEYLQINQPFGDYLTPGSAAMVIILEGCSSGAVISFLLVQLMTRGSKKKISV
jgi:fumarate reductase subunit D